MAMQYINYLRAKTHIGTAEKSETPVLSDEDEQFLDRITSQGDKEAAPPPLPARPPKDAQTAIMDGANNIGLPESPMEEVEDPTMDVKEVEQGTEDQTPGKTARNSTWSWLRRDSREKTVTRKDQEDLAASLMDVAEGLKTDDEGTVEDKEAKKEEEEMTIALERLNLAAINNRVFSLSTETQELLQKFNLVFKDLIVGAPTAYDDLERLLANSDRQIQGIYKSLPNFLQKLIESLPNKMTSTFAPEIKAAAAERASLGGPAVENAGKAAKKVFKTPSLKDLIGKPGAIASMLRSIIQFLRARFPAFMGTNVLWSMAVFVLLLVFWYCHKRGREVRLEQERELTEQEVARLDVEYRTAHAGEVFKTTAKENASMEEVKEGMLEVEAAEEATKMIDDGRQSEPAPSTLSATVQPAERVGA